MARKKSKFPTFNSKTVRNVALTVTSIGVIGGAALFRGCDDKQLSLEEQQAEQIRQMHKSEMHRVDSLLKQKYKITDRASFDKLYRDALPLIQLSMFSTEVLVKKAYADASGRSKNTNGLGSYFVPKNGDPKSSEWILTSKYLETHKDMEVSGDKALDLADGWFSTREGGRILRTMFNKLKGCELTVNEFAAIATCYYNSERRGKNFCEFVHDNYQDSVKCASWLIPEQGVEGFGGIAKRATHEACMYLNINDYVSQIGDQRVAKIEGTDIYKTSVTQLTEAECLEAGMDLRMGNTKKLEEKANKINRYVCKGGKSVSQIVYENVESKDRQMCLLQFTDQSIDLLKQLVDNRYNAALDLYNEGKYEEALAGFKSIITNGYDGADLHNDLAVTYYHLGRYEECLQECRYVLHETGETSEFAHAYYNAGRAAEALNQPQRAYDNYKLALKQDKQNKFYQKLVLKLQKELNITNEPIEEMIKPKVKTKAENQKTATKKPNPITPKAKANAPVASKKAAPKKTASKPVKPAAKATPQKKPAAKRGGSRNSR